MKKFLAGLLIFIFVFGAPRIVRAESGNESKIAQLSQAAALDLLAKQKELVECRTENSRTFLDSNGRKTMFLAAEPINYRAADGKFYPIETAIELAKTASSSQIKTAKGQTASMAQQASKYKYHAIKNSLKTYFAASSGEGVKLEATDKSVEFSLVHRDKRPAKMEANKIRYEKVLESCDLEYAALPGQLKEEVILYSAPASPIISFKVNLNGLQYRQGKNGSYELVDEFGQPVLNIEPTFMYEKADQANARNIESRFHLDAQGQLYFDLVMDMNWLKDKRRQYPVVVDPTVTITSYKREWQRCLINAPESWGTIECNVVLYGPGWHGWNWKNDYAHFHLKNLTTGVIYSQYHDRHNFCPEQPIKVDAAANNQYEVALYAGAAYANCSLFGRNYYGNGYALIKYGGDNTHLFATLPEKTGEYYTGTAADPYCLTKSIEVAYEQKMRYSFAKATSSGGNGPITSWPSFKVYRDNEMLVDRVQPESGSVTLKPGFKYTVALSPEIRSSSFNHYRAELSFPELTKNYESRIVLETDTGAIDSSFKLPRDGDLLLEYKVEKNGTVGSVGPAIKVERRSAAGATLEELNFNSANYYNWIVGGRRIHLAGETDYGLIVKRGINGAGGWGAVSLNVFHESNQYASVANPQLIDGAANLSAGQFAGKNYQIKFKYTDPDGNPLRQYKLLLSKSGGTAGSEKELLISDPSGVEGDFVIPYRLDSFGYATGDVILCKVKAWDGFDWTVSDETAFTVDFTPPLIEKFTGEVREDNTIYLEKQVREVDSLLKNVSATWKINGEIVATQELTELETNWTITGLAKNVRVDVSLNATDILGNTVNQSQVFYTYPEKAELVAPTRITGNVTEGFGSTLKIKQVPASYYRVERYRGEVSEATKDYDTGFLDPNSLNSVQLGIPTVCLVSPSGEVTYDQPAIINISADAQDVDGRIAKVEFYANGVLLGVDSRAPYSLIWSNVPCGSYQLIAQAYDNDGRTGLSPAKMITVSNSPALVWITAPGNGSSFTEPTTITVSAEAEDSDGKVVKVEFYANDALIGSDTAAPYSITWANVAGGDYVIKAKAVDNNGTESFSNPIAVTVNEYSGNNMWYGTQVKPIDNYNPLLPKGEVITYRYYDDDKDSGQQYWFWYRRWPKKVYISEEFVKVFTDVTTYFWVPRDVTVTNYAINDDWLSVYLNGQLVFSNGDTNNVTDWNKPITLNLKGGQWNEVRLTVDNCGGKGYNLVFANNFKYLIQQALTNSGGGKVYMKSFVFQFIDPIFVVKNPDITAESQSLNNELTSLTAVALDAESETETALDGPAYYAIPEKIPAQPHQSYIYRVYTKNGDKVVYQDSPLTPVLNNAPEIVVMEPASGAVGHTRKDVKINLTEVYDGDNDPLKYEYSLQGFQGSGETTSAQYQWTSVPDGAYAWTVKAKDDFGGETTVSGTIIVDSTVPLASFRINDGTTFTNNPAVNLSIFDLSETVNKIRVSNDGATWAEYTAWAQPVVWNLASGDGAKTVYLQAQNLAGAVNDTWGPTTQQTVILDTTPPEVAAVAVQKEGGAGSVFFHWRGATDATSGLAGANIQRFESGGWVNVENGYQKDNLTLAAAGYNLPAQIRLRFVDRAGNASFWVEATGYTKAEAATIDLSQSSGGYSAEAGHFLNLKINPARGAVQYELVRVGNPGGGDTGVIELTDGVYRDTGLQPHQKYGYVIYTYNSLDEITESDEFEITVANNLPATPAGIFPKGYLPKTGGVSFEIDRAFDLLDVDGDELTVEYYLSVDGVNFAKLENAIADDLLEGQTYWWFIKIDDNHGGIIQTDPVSFIPDQTPPEISVDNLSLLYATEQRVKIKIQDTVSGLAGITVNGVPATQADQEIIINNQGANPLYIMAVDNAGNVATFSHIYHVDATPPTSAGLRFNLTQRDGVYRANQTPIPVEWDAGDPETGVSQFYYAWSESDAPVADSEMESLALLGAQSVYSANIPGVFADGKTYYFHLKPENSLGLKGTLISSPPLLYDHTAPELSFRNLTGGVEYNGVTYYSTLERLGVNFTANDEHTGIIKTEYALVVAKNQEEILWYNTIADMSANTNITNGTAYYLAVRVNNGAYLAATAYSNILIFDATAPEVEVTVSPEQNDNRMYLARVQMTEPESVLNKLEYCVGSAPGKADLSKGLPGADATGWFTILNPAAKLELRQYADIPLGTIYYVTVRAANISGLATTQTGAGVKIVAGMAPVVRDDGSFSANQSALHFEWYFPNPPRQIQNYEYQIRSDKETLKSWTSYSGDGQVSLIVDNLALTHNNTYYCEARARFADGAYSEVGRSDGITIDITPPEIAGFTYNAFANGDGPRFSWEATDNESGVRCYAALGSSPGGADLTGGWITVNNLQSFTINQTADGTSLNFSNGQNYYIGLLVENEAGLVTQRDSGVIKVDLTPPPTPVVIDEGNYTNKSDYLKFSWKWTQDDPESGIAYYNICLTNERAISGGETWYEVGGETAAELQNLELIHGETYYLAVKAVNNAGLETVGFSDGILIDLTAPSPALVTDYGDYTLSANSLQVSMVASDAESGISGYGLSLGTLDHPGEVFENWRILTGGGIENLSLTGLSLEEGKIYFFTITAWNQAGSVSMVSTSDGIMVDSKTPEVSNLIIPYNYSADQTTLSFDWRLKTTPSGIAEVEYAVSADPAGGNLDWKVTSSIFSETVTGLKLEDGKTYYAFLRAQSRAAYEASPATWSGVARSNPVTIDTTPPEIIRIKTPSFGSVQQFLLEWEGRDNQSGIVEYRYAVGTYRGGADLTDGWISLVTTAATISFYRSDLPLEREESCYLSVIAKNGAGIWSPVSSSEPIAVDWTRPEITSLKYNDSFLKSKDSIFGINWAAVDAESGVRGYKITLVKIKDGSSLAASVVPVAVTGGVINLTGLSLDEGDTYYIAMQVQNGAGLWSEVYYSDSVKVDTIPPTVIINDFTAELVTNTGKAAVAWHLSEPGTVAITLLCPDGGRLEEATANTGGQSEIYNFNQTLEGVYKLSFIPTDAAGNSGSAITRTIRLNSKPMANLGPDLTVTKGTAIEFVAQVSDSDGTIVEYWWDFGNGATGGEINSTYTYRMLGSYTVSLRVKDNDGKWSDSAILQVTVTNTTSGELNTDEEWDGDIQITGDIIVPQGVVLTVNPGAGINFTGNYQILVRGKIIINGTNAKPVKIGAVGQWNGIRLEDSEPGSSVNYADIQNATAGVVVLRSQAEIVATIFRKNRIGLHIIAANPIVRGCLITENTVYGIKEDDAAAPTVIGCTFVANGAANYYEDTRAIIDTDTLNQLGSNRDNR